MGLFGFGGGGNKLEILGRENGGFDKQAVPEDSSQEEMVEGTMSTQQQIDGLERRIAALKLQENPDNGVIDLLERQLDNAKDTRVKGVN